MGVATMVRRGRSLAGVVSARTLATALIVVAGLGIAGCGVASEPTAVDAGDALYPGGDRSGDSMTSLPTANAASQPDQLVRDFFAAAVGGGDEAAQRARLFLTAEGLGHWKPESTKLTILRLSSVTRGVQTGGRTPVTVTYQIVGELTNQGSVEVLANSGPHKMTFMVVPREEGSAQLRIEKMTGAIPDGLFISDVALETHYRVQPVYFWDLTGRWLVPDLRYLPLTMQPDVRPNQVVQWLLNGPSQWLKPAVRSLPQGTKANGAPVSRPGGFVVNLSSQAEADGPQGLSHLAAQLRWSLRSSSIPSIDLQIEGQARDLASTDISKVNPAASLPPPQPFAVINGRVVPREPGGASAEPGSLLTSKENQRVVAAAISRDTNRALNVGAFVQRSAGGAETLVTVRRIGTKLESVRVNLPSTMGRPVFVPGTTTLLIASVGRLYVVDPANKTPRVVNGLDGVEAVAVAPDGRRVALVVNGKALVAALWPVAGNNFTLGQLERQLLPREVPRAVAVAWQSEDRVLVAGTSDGNRPAMWEVTADGVIAKDRSSGLRASIPTDVVAYPASPQGFSPGGGAVMVETAAGAGEFAGELVLFPEGQRSPFYAS